MRLLVDWGSSGFRVWASEGQSVRELRRSSQGVFSFSTFKERERFLVETMREWESEITEVMAIGMVGSAAGIAELTPLPLPLGIDSLQEGIVTVPLESSLVNCIRVAPGAQVSLGSRVDLMRGEEVQALSLGVETGLVIAPGTHSKHIEVSGGRIQNFQTALSGELFEAIRRMPSIAGALNSLESEGISDDDFAAGVEQSSGPLQRELFMIRTGQLFETKSREWASYLSGLLIGYEIRTMVLGLAHENTHLVGSGNITALYSQAFDFFDVDVVTHDEKAVIKNVFESFFH